MQPHILVADDHPLTAEGIRRILGRISSDISVVHVPEQVWACLSHRAPDLLVLDLSFRNSHTTGFDLLREIHQGLPRLPVLIVSMFDEPELRDAAKNEGARGFVSKIQVGRFLVEAASAILEGRTAFPEYPDEKAATLSARQLQVSNELTHGLHEKEIAAKLGLSVRMVESHLNRAKRRIKARSLTELVAIFIRRGYQLLPRRDLKKTTDE